MLPHYNLVYMSEATHVNCILMYSVIWYIYETQVLWDMTLCCLANSSQDLMKWRCHNLTKYQEPLSQLHCIVSHKTSVFRNTAMRPSKPTLMCFVIHCCCLWHSVLFGSLNTSSYLGVLSQILSTEKLLNSC